MNPWLQFVLTCLLMAAVAVLIVLGGPLAFARWVERVANRRPEPPGDAPDPEAKRE